MPLNLLLIYLDLSLRMLTCRKLWSHCKALKWYTFKTGPDERWLTHREPLLNEINATSVRLSYFLQMWAVIQQGHLCPSCFLHAAGSLSTSPPYCDATRISSMFFGLYSYQNQKPTNLKIRYSVTVVQTARGTLIVADLQWSKAFHFFPYSSFGFSLLSKQAWV